MDNSLTVSDWHEQLCGAGGSYRRFLADQRQTVDNLRQTWRQRTGNLYGRIPQRSQPVSG